MESQSVMIADSLASHRDPGSLSGAAGGPGRCHEGLLGAVAGAEREYPLCPAWSSEDLCPADRAGRDIAVLRGGGPACSLSSFISGTVVSSNAASPGACVGVFAPALLLLTNCPWCGLGVTFRMGHTESPLLTGKDTICKRQIYLSRQ